MDWLHCNKCMAYPSRGVNNEYYLCPRAHFTCQACVVPASGSTNKRCPGCPGEVGADKLVPVGSKMRPQLKNLFRDGPRQVSELDRTLQFHRNQATILLRLEDKETRDAEERARRAEEEAREMEDKVRRLQVDKDRLDRELHQLNQELVRAANASPLAQDEDNKEERREDLVYHGHKEDMRYVIFVSNLN